MGVPEPSLRLRNVGLLLLATNITPAFPSPTTTDTRFSPLSDPEDIFAMLCRHTLWLQEEIT